MKLIDKDALVAEIEKTEKISKDASEKAIDTYFKIHFDGWVTACRSILSFIDTLEVKEINNVWHDTRRTIPEDGREQIICIKEDGLAVSTVGKIVNGTIKWVYLNDLLNISDVQVKEVNLKKDSV